MKSTWIMIGDAAYVNGSIEIDRHAEAGEKKNGLHRPAYTGRAAAASSDSPMSLVVSWVLMIPLLCFASNGLFWFQGEGNNPLTARFGLLASGKTSTVGNTAITFLLFTILPVVIFPKMKSVFNLCRRDRVFAGLGAWVMLSCLWSQFPMVSLEWAPVAVLNIACAFYLYRRFNPGQQIRLLLVLGWTCLVLSIVLSLFFPKYGIDHTDASAAWEGMYGQKNLCSMNTAFLLLGGLYAPATSVFSKVARVAYVGLSVFLIVMTQSVTGRITLGCLLAYFIASKLVSRLRANDRWIAASVVTALAMACVVVALSKAKAMLFFLGKDPTLTGRTEIWQASMLSILKHPILGYGYRAFWRGYQGESANASFAAHWAVPAAHNALLEVWLSLGAVGLALVLYSLLRAIRDALVCIRAESPYLAWYASVVFLTIVTSVAEGFWVNPNNLMWILYILACVGLSEGARRTRLGLQHG